MSTIHQDDTKRRLIEAAGEEFAAKGFEGATVRSICNRAGANLAAVNYHFGDKSQLYVQAVLEAHRCGVDFVLDADFERAAPGDQLRMFIRHFLENVLAIDRRGSWQNALMIREMLGPTEAADVLVREAIRPRFERLGSIMGRICPEAERRKLDALCMSVVGQCLQYKMARSISEKIMGPERFAALVDLEFLSAHIADFTLAALGQAPRLDASGRPAALPGEGEDR